MNFCGQGGWREAGGAHWLAVGAGPGAFWGLFVRDALQEALGGHTVKSDHWTYWGLGLSLAPCPEVLQILDFSGFCMSARR